jgi:putative ATP-dependent endonuclease of the OLD family
MYIKELKLWNFRKYGSKNDLNREPDLIVPFSKGLNVLIGENDSGKTAILDAVKLVLKTHAYEWIKVEKEDFTTNNEKLRIELVFASITDDEAKHFIEWLGWVDEIVADDKVEKRPQLILIYQAELKNGKVIPSDVKAGMDGVGHLLNADAREFLKCTYLKALRDADNELMAKKNSRLSQILQEHQLFKKKDKDTLHELEVVVNEANTKIKSYFENKTQDKGGKSNYEQVVKPIDTFLKEFINEKYLSNFDISSSEIKSILEKISLGIEGFSKLGLGTMNRLFMAAELLHLKKEKYDGLKLCLIEELEAHLHPQAQLKIIQALESEVKDDIQIILTTHSPNIASKIDLKSLIICNRNNVFPLGSYCTVVKNKPVENFYTKLEKENFTYLERFLDVTKSNLFFAKGLILVEGWAEEIIIPELAKKLGYDLTKKEVSVVNVASTAYLHFAKIFLRNDGKDMKIPVAIVTDLDNRPDANGKFKELSDLDGVDDKKIKTKYDNLEKLKSELQGTSVHLELAKEWTLEWCLYKSSSLSDLFKESVSEVHNGTVEFKKNEDTRNFKIEFKEKLISKLRKEQGTSELDKVKVASSLAEKIKTSKNLKINEKETYIKYLVDAIRHACSYEN